MRKKHISLSVTAVQLPIWSVLRKNWRWLAIGLAILLAYGALKEAPWPEVWNLLSGLGIEAILILLALNLAMLPLMTARWWFILRRLQAPVNLFAASLYRCSSNAVSYLTPGPHFGGEPLLVYYLRRYQGLTISSGTTSVIVDRLLELLASMMVLALCLIYMVGNNIIVLGSWYNVGGIILVLLLLLYLLVALFFGHRPFSSAILLVQQVITGKPSNSLLSSRGGFLTGIAQSERLAESLFRHYPSRFLMANLFSAAHWLAIFFEFWIMAALLGVELSLVHLCAIVVVARLAYYTPLPAAIGVLELALPHVTTTLGLGASLGFSLCVIIRLRDLVFTLGGLGVTMNYLARPKKSNSNSYNSL